MIVAKSFYCGENFKVYALSKFQITVFTTLFITCHDLSVTGSSVPFNPLHPFCMNNLFKNCMQPQKTPNCQSWRYHTP